jgi:transposase InsO family protein
VADFTYVATWAGTVYVAFAIDVFSRKIVGWRTRMSKETDLVLDAIDRGLRDRRYQSGVDGERLVHHSDAGSQYTSFRFTQHLLDAGIDASIGTVGDALDNALAESTIGRCRGRGGTGPTCRPRPCTSTSATRATTTVGGLSTLSAAAGTARDELPATGRRGRGLGANNFHRP